MSRLNFHHLRYFHAVAQSGSLTRAAASLNLSPSALSVQIQQLEAQLGQALFERVGRRLVLSEAGRIALDHADAIFATGDELLHRLKGASPSRPSHVRVGALATLSRNFQVAFLSPSFLQQGLRFVLRSGTLKDLLAALASHQIDVLLTNTLPPRDEETPWNAHRLDEQPVSLVGPKARRGRERTLEDILTHERLIVPTPENHIRGEFDSFVQRLGVTPKIVAEVDDMAMIRVLARQGLGYAITPPVVVRDELKSGELAELGRLSGLVETFFAIVPHRRFPNPAVQALLACQSPSAG